MSDLLPCPFCGGLDVRVQGNGFVRSGVQPKVPTWHEAVCDTCEFVGPGFDAPDLAKGWWNTRVIPEKQMNTSDIIQTNKMNVPSDLKWPLEWVTVIDGVVTHHTRPLSSSSNWEECFGPAHVPIDGPTMQTALTTAREEERAVWEKAHNHACIAWQQKCEYESNKARVDGREEAIMRLEEFLNRKDHGALDLRIKAAIEDMSGGYKATIALYREAMLGLLPIPGAEPKTNKK